MTLRLVALGISVGMLALAFDLDDWRWGIVWAVSVAFWLDRIVAESKP
jgi:hypothetical protein